MSIYAVGFTCGTAKAEMNRRPPAISAVMPQQTTAYFGDFWCEIFWPDPVDSCGTNRAYGQQATSKDYGEAISESEFHELEATMSSMQISETDESWLNESIEFGTIDEDEEMKALLECLRKKNKSAHPGKDYCFQTDPLWSPEEDRTIEEPDPDNRLKELHWCKCGECQIMTSVNDCLCCTEIYALESMLEPGTTCISKDPSFNEVCQDKEELIRLLTSMQITTGRAMDFQNTLFSSCRISSFHYVGTRPTW